MQVKKGDLFKPTPDTVAICITTNSVIKRNGEAVMGAGIALAAKQRWPDLPILLAEAIKRGEPTSVLRSTLLNNTKLHIISFQTKTDWKLPSTVPLIVKSAKKLVEIADGWTGNIWLPIPGCGYGGLSWDVVKPAINPILDDRFFIIIK